MLLRLGLRDEDLLLVDGWWGVERDGRGGVVGVADGRFDGVLEEHAPVVVEDAGDRVQAARVDSLVVA